MIAYLKTLRLSQSKGRGMLLTALFLSSYMFTYPAAADPHGTGNSIYNSSNLYVKNFSPVSPGRKRILGNYGYARITTPLELVIGRFYLGDGTLLLSSYSAGGRNLPGSRRSEILSHTNLNGIKIIPESIENAAPDLARGDSIRFQTISDKSSFGIDLLSLKSLQIGNYKYGDTLLGSFTMEYNLNRENLHSSTLPVNLLFGITSIYSTPERKDLVKVSGTEYGTVFFVPGLQISGKSVIFQAMFELPVYRINPENAIYHQQDMRANFGMKYILH